MAWRSVKTYELIKKLLRVRHTDIMLLKTRLNLVGACVV